MGRPSDQKQFPPSPQTAILQFATPRVHHHLRRPASPLPPPLMPPSHPAPPSQERPAEPAPLWNASSSGSPEEFAAIENEDDKQEMYVKVHTKKSAFQAFAASLEQRFTNLERANTELQGENQKLHRLVASLGVSNQELHGLVASLGASNEALGASNRALQGRVDRLERTFAASEQNAGLYLDVAHFYATDADQGAGDLTNDIRGHVAAWHSEPHGEGGCRRGTQARPARARHTRGRAILGPHRRLMALVSALFAAAAPPVRCLPSSRSAEAPRRACTLNVLHASSGAHPRSARQLSRFAETLYMRSHVAFLVKPARGAARARSTSPSPSQALLRLVVDYFLVPLCSPISRHVVTQKNTLLRFVSILRT